MLTHLQELFNISSQSATSMYALMCHQLSYFQDSVVLVSKSFYASYMFLNKYEYKQRQS